MVTEKPFAGRTRLAFMQYMCERHNEVNKRLSSSTSTRQTHFSLRVRRKGLGTDGLRLRTRRADQRPGQERWISLIFFRSIRCTWVACF